MDSTAKDLSTVEPDVGQDGDDGEAYSLKKVPLWLRLIYGGTIVLFAGLFAWAGLAKQVHQGTLWPLGWLWVPAWGIAAWWASTVVKRDLRKDYSTRLVPVPGARRRLHYGVATFAFVVLVACVFLSQYSRGDTSGPWVYVLPGVIIYALFMLAINRNRFDRVMTKAALREQGRLLSTPAAPLAAVPAPWEIGLERLLGLWFVRYGLGFGAFALSGYFFNLNDIGKSSVVLGLTCMALGVWLMKEVFLWVIGAAIVGGMVALFAGAIAGIPVSAAIIIGALIIASSNNNKP